jgi:hypothetical protein
MIDITRKCYDCRYWKHVDCYDYLPVMPAPRNHWCPQWREQYEAEEDHGRPRDPSWFAVRPSDSQMERFKRGIV